MQPDQNILQRRMAGTDSTNGSNSSLCYPKSLFRMDYSCEEIARCSIDTPRSSRDRKVPTKSTGISMVAQTVRRTGEELPRMLQAPKSKTPTPDSP